MTTPKSPIFGMGLCLLATLTFASQDAVTKILIKDYPLSQFVMLRYWAFALAAIIFLAAKGQLRHAIKAQRPVLQICRSTLLALEIGVFAFGLAYMGLAEMHALFATFPLIVMMLAMVVLKEQVGWRRKLAIVVAFLGALLIIKPGFAVFHPAALIPLTAALMFAAYNIITRITGQSDSFYTSMLYMGVIGALLFTPFGLSQWTTPDNKGALLMGVIAVTGIVGHLLLVKALEYAPASVLQPLNYFLVVWATIIGIGILGERPDLWSIMGAVIIVGSGLFAIFRERMLKAKLKHSE